MFLFRDVRYPAAEPVVLVCCSSDHCSGTVDHQCSQVNITAFTNAEQPISVPGAMLLRRDPNRCRHLPTGTVLPGITHRGDHGRGDHRADTTQLLEAHTLFVLLSQSLDQLIHLTHAIIQPQQIVPHTMQQSAKVARQTVLRIFKLTCSPVASPV